MTILLNVEFVINSIYTIVLFVIIKIRKIQKTKLNI